jgi:hypothetical protein
MLARREDKTPCSPAWRKLYQEYGLGRLVDNKMLHWTREDLRQWQSLVNADQPAHELAQAGADRTTVAQHSANEKLTTASVQDQRLFCHAINAPLYLTHGEQAVHPEMEYRAHYKAIDINRYAACLIIENLESYVYCQRFNWPELPETLVLYRGHNKATQALHALLESRKRSLHVVMFPDTDPAGLGIAMSMTAATHIIAPQVRSLDPGGLLRDRFALQLQRRPNLQSQVKDYSDAFQSLVTDILQTGTAVSQEWLCAHKVPLTLIPLRDQLTPPQSGMSGY